MKVLQINRNILFIAALCVGAISLTNCRSTADSTAANNGNKAVVVGTNQANTTGENTNGKSSDAIITNANNVPSVTENTNGKPDKTADIAKTKLPTGEKVGVPECDDYIRKYEMCLTKIPEAQREKYRKTFDTTLAGLKKAVTNPQAKAVIGISCKQSIETAKDTMKAFSCDW